MATRRAQPGVKKSSGRRTLRPPGPARVYFAVALREIDELFDLTPRRAIHTTEEGVPELAFSMMSAGAKWYDLRGEEVPPPVPRPMMQRPLQGRTRLVRTFDRTRSVPLLDRHVYVFRADGPDSDSGELIHELAYGGDGQFSYVSRDGRQPGRGKHSYLSLEVGGHYYFYLTAYPLPDQAIADMQQHLRARAVYLWDDLYLDVNDGAGPDPRRARPYLLRDLDGSLPGDGKASYVLHLPCVLREAVRRARAYHDALERLLALHTEASSFETEWGLARRIDYFTSMSSSAAAARRLVDGPLEEYLAAREPKLANGPPLVVDELCEDLLEWIGTLEAPRTIRDAESLEQVFVHEGEGETIRRWRPVGPPGSFTAGIVEQPRCSAFTLAVNDYATADESTIDAIATLIAWVHQCLDATDAGREWLAENFDRIVVRASPRAEHAREALHDDGAGQSAPDASARREGILQAADAGAAMLLQGKALKKRVSEGAGHVLKAYSRLWGERYRRDAAREFASWIRFRLGIRAEVLYGATIPSAQMQAILREKINYDASGRYESRRVSGDAEAPQVVLLKDWEKKLQASKNAVDAFGLAIACADFWATLRTASKDPTDQWAWVGVGRSGSSVLDSLRTVKQIDWQGKLFRAPVRTSAINPWGFAKNALSLLETIHKLDSTSDRGARRGLEVAAVGYAAAAAAGVLTGGAAIVAGVIGTIVTETGAFLQQHFSDAAVFLRACRFGETTFDWARVDKTAEEARRKEERRWIRDPVRGGLDGLGVALTAGGAGVDWLVMKKEQGGVLDEYWAKGPREAFRKDFPAQHRALDQILHDYDPDLVFDLRFEQLYLAFDVWNPLLLADTTLWEVDGWVTMIRNLTRTGPGMERVFIKNEKVVIPGAVLLRAAGGSPQSHQRTCLVKLCDLPTDIDLTRGFVDIECHGMVKATIAEPRKLVVPRELKLGKTVQWENTFEPFRNGAVLKRIRTYSPAEPRRPPRPDP